ncbi:MAG: asparaginase [Acidobacteriota bacterium]|nr:asparaginase [Acidobacteriota bacterium]
MTEKKRNVLVLSMGGTMGMRPLEGGTLAPDAVLADLFHWVPELRNLAGVNVEVLQDIDSSQMLPEHWVQLARRVEEAQNEHLWDGIVVLHGTDTMAYTASALSFLLPALTLPVVFTGGQRPLAVTRTDARGNLIGAVESALDGPVEVMIYFNNYALRGNRATKVAISDFEGFGSPNFPPLGHAGIDWDWNRDIAWPIARRPSIWQGLPESLPTPPLVLPWVPGLEVHNLIQALSKQWSIILEAFGTGNMPIPGELRDCLKEFIESGGLVFIKSQVNRGSVALGAYAPGMAIRELGIRGGRDMTREAMVTKLMVLKALGLTNDKIRSMMVRSLAGELTEAH